MDTPGSPLQPTGYQRLAAVADQGWPGRFHRRTKPDKQPGIPLAVELADHYR